MSRAFLSVSVLILLGGCAHVTPHPTVQQQHIVKPVAKPVAPPVVQPVTPNAIVKKRWYQHFPHHPKWFHH